jgi:hypothetical protein
MIEPSSRFTCVNDTLALYLTEAILMPSGISPIIFLPPSIPLLNQRPIQLLASVTSPTHPHCSICGPLDSIIPRVLNAHLPLFHSSWFRRYGAMHSYDHHVEQYNTQYRCPFLPSWERVPKLSKLSSQIDPITGMCGLEDQYRIQVDVENVIAL